MRKLIYVFLTISIYMSNLPAQTIDGNYELDSLVVTYIIKARDIVQTGNDGNEYTTTYDDSAATYDVTIGWPNASDTNIFDFSLPYFDIGDTMAVTSVPLGSPAALAAFGLGLNTDFTAGASTVDVVGWDNTNKKATPILTSMSAGDAIVGGVSGDHTETVANSGNFTEKDYDVLVNKIQWICNGMSVNVEWDGSTTESAIACLSGNGVYNGNNLEFPAIPINATGDTAGVLGDIQFSTVGADTGDTYTIWIELSKQPAGYDVPNYEHNTQLGYPVDYTLGNRP